VRLVLAGQPNSGKSTIFNAVAGYRSATANFPGSSVGFTLSRALVAGHEVEIVDLPGIYSMTAVDQAETLGLRYLIEQPCDVIVNVVDSSRLGRSLELTLQLLELERPMVVALNMIDEAQRKGIVVDADALARELGVPVVATVGSRGRGLRALFRESVRAAMGGRKPRPVPLDREVEAAIETVSGALRVQGVDASFRLLAQQFLENGSELDRQLPAAVRPSELTEVRTAIARLEEAHGWSADQIVSGSRHAMAHAIEDRVATVGHPRIGWRERLDLFLLHPWTGGPLMLLILGGFFYLVFGVGQRLEPPLLAAFDSLRVALAALLPVGTLSGTVASGIVMGLSGGVAIVLPYVLPFLVGLAVLEDTGYLPRMAYILDSFMHRIGLHGKSVLPMILGYGCSVPAIMATSILESPRDRRITTALTAFIPCSARTTVIYGLVAAYMGPLWALAIYLLNIVIVVALGNFLARSVKGRSPGLILEIPDLRLPMARTLLNKTWLSLKEFVTVAWPLLIASSAVLAVLEWLGAARIFDAVLSPLTVGLLGLPAAVGMTLVFGVLRKELTLVMLVQALGTTQIATVMSTTQLFTFTLFVVFYVPCVATVAAMVRRVGTRDTAWIAALTVVVATVVAVAGRILLTILPLA